MDLKQRKLNRAEWKSIEVPVSESEKDILNLIIQGYHDVNIRINNNNSIFNFLKIEYNEKMEDYIYIKYFSEQCKTIESTVIKINKNYKNINVNANVKINSADKIRFDRNDDKTLKKQDIYENVLLKHAEEFLRYKLKNDKKQMMFHYYTLFKLLKNNIKRVNRHILSICNNMMKLFEDEIEISTIIENADEIIEKNKNLLKYSDLVLYEHQKEIFTVCKNPDPKFVLYMAPTGTGKTLTPLALSEQNKIIFVCAARHVGLALAKAAISIGKKIAFAFGCASADDIRLHYFAAKEYSKNKRTGGIGKVDNSVGDEVEIIICDIKSYLPAMYYMKAFNTDDRKLIVYWDEPTITLDYENHEFHPIINQIWRENLIPNMVLSSATLPKLQELTEAISDFKNKFPGSQVYNIVSHDCKKSIPIINKDGFTVLPHYLSENYEEIVKIAEHCENYLTLVRYFDLKEVVDFITYVNKNNFTNMKMKLDRHFETIDDLDMKSIKIYYIKMLQNILQGTWGAIHTHFRMNRTRKIPMNNSVDLKGNKITKSRSIGPGTSVTSNSAPYSNTNVNAGSNLIRLASEQIVSSTPLPTNANANTNSNAEGTAGVYVTTKDAHTLTDGPTIFITNEIEKIAKFCIQQANIPSLVMDEIMKKIEFNNVLNEKIDLLETNWTYIKEKSEQNMKNNVQGARNKSTKDFRKINRETQNEDETSNKNEMAKLTNEINSLRSLIKSATLNETFVPNKHLHIKKWAEDVATTNENVFSSDIDENVVNEIMLLNGIENSWKILLMMGIGVFINHENIKYTEIMKTMADEQKLYMIIASSDYIYGTNYQFCHGYLSKDLNLTQEKIIQAMGRIGRNNIQQNYTLRFRDDTQIMKLFTNETEKPEVNNMNKLFSNVVA